MKNIQLAVIGTAFLAGSMMQPVAAAEFSEMDANEDGSISIEEAEGNATLMENWNAADSNQDGGVDVEEFSALEILVAPDGEGQEAESATE